MNRLDQKCYSGEHRYEPRYVGSDRLWIADVCSKCGDVIYRDGPKLNTRHLGNMHGTYTPPQSEMPPPPPPKGEK